MEKEICVKGIILGGFPYGEYGKRLIILTDRLGKVTVFARSMAKQNSKMIGIGRIFTSAEFLLSEGKGAYSLHGAKVIDAFEEIAAMPEVSFTAQYVLEVADYFAKEGMAEADAKAMLNLIFVTLAALRNGELEAPLIRRIFELRMLVQEGIWYEHPEIVSEDSEVCWNYAVHCPLSHLYDSGAWKTRGTDDFRESVSLIMAKEVSHHFRSAELL